MKICKKCECIYPDYHKKCPSCGSEENKEWEKSYHNDDLFTKKPIKDEKNNKNMAIIDYEYNDLKEFIVSDSD